MSGNSRRRQGELVRKAFEILLSEPHGLHAGEVLSRLEGQVVLTDFEIEEYPNQPGVRRFEKVVRFATISPVKAGWLLKQGPAGIWTLTDKGKEALLKYEDPEEFMREAGRLYRQWRASNPVGTVVEDEEADDEDALSYGDDPGEIVERIRAEHIPTERVQHRKQAEQSAREFLDRWAGRMTSDQAFELGRIFNSDLRGTERHDRFKPAFHGATMQRLGGSMDVFNDWTLRLWDPNEEKALAALDEIVTDPSTFPGAGRSYPTLLAYLRDPTRFGVWIPATTKGLKALTGFQSGPRAEGLDAYLRFSQGVNAFAQEYGLEPQEIDIVLTVAGQIAKRARRDLFLSLSSAPKFLQDLRANNTGEWLSEQRNRSTEELFEPFRRLMEAVAQRYLRDLDPNLITEVKTNKVLASLRKRWPDESGEYNEFYWGAFSRSKKQEDVQLFVSVNPEGLRYGLYLGSAQREQLERIKKAVRRQTEQIVGLLSLLGPRLIFYREDSQKESLDVRTVDDFLLWLEGPAPSAAEELGPDDPHLRSAKLIERVGSLLVGVHPLAVAAWAEDIPLKEDEDREDLLEERYSLDRLVADTLLPIDDLEEWLELLRQEDKRQAIFYGSPGTGKTHVARCLAQYMSAGGGDVRVVQFHPAFSYEDFLEGLRPFSKPDGSVGYEIRPGVFLDFCEKARGSEGTFVFVIDEINRAEIGAVLGELMMLLEYRGETLQLPYSKGRFSVPSNVVVLATMNTADRSLALVDFALRRRFHAIELPPSREILAAYLSTRGEDAELPLRFFDLVQSRVSDPQFAPGHTYWMADDLSPRGLDRIWRYQIRPYLKEYWFENQQQLVDLESEVEVLLAEGD